MSKPKGHLLWFSAGVTLLFNGWLLVWLLLKPGTPDQVTAVDNLAQTAGYLLGAAFCLMGLRFFRRPGADADDQACPQRPWVSLLFCASLVLSGLAQAIYAYYQYVLQQLPPSPSWADAFFLSAYPFQLLAILLLPTRRLSGIARSRVMLDGLIMMTAVVTLSWYFILGPTIEQGQGSPLAKVVGVSYPFLDLVTVMCLILLLSRAMPATLRAGVSLLICALIMVVIIDTIYEYQMLQNTYATGSLLDLGWPVGDMLIGLAVQLMNIAYRSKQVQEQGGSEQQYQRLATFTRASMGLALLHYLFIPAVLLLAISVWHSGQTGMLVQGVYFGAAALIGLILLRQVFALRQTLYYNQALAQANRQLEQQSTQIQAAYERERQLNEFKDQFILNVNHELRTPLTQVWGYLNLLSDYHGQLEAAMQETFIAHALQGCDDLLSLVNTILDSARSGSQEQRPPEYSVVSVAVAARAARALFAPQGQGAHAIDLDIPEELFVRTDQDYLHRILVNLLSNALKYSPDQTTVVVTAVLYTEISQTGDSSSGGSSEVRICVQDAGQGIPPSEIPLLFGKFIRLKRDLGGPVRGTGLGLYLCRQLTETMGGRIWVESEGIAGQGSRFFLALPSAHQPVSPILDSSQGTFTTLASAKPDRYASAPKSAR